MTHAQVISIENPVIGPAGTSCDNCFHSKWVIRRRYVDQVLLPQLKRMPFDGAETFKAVIDTDVEPALTRGSRGEPLFVTWLGKTIPIKEGGTPCFLSHLTLWQRCVDQNLTLFILEDDAKLDPANEALVSSCIAEYASGLFDNDILYLQLAIPWHPTNLKVFHPADCVDASPKLLRVKRTSDLSGSAAYVVRPGSARALLQRAVEKGTGGPDGCIHHSLNEGRLGVLVMRDYARGFMLNDHFAEWNHKHDVNQK